MNSRTRLASFGVALVLGGHSSGFARAQPPPPPPPGVPQPDLRADADRLFSQVRRLNQEVGEAMGAAPGGVPLRRDLRELDQAADEFRARLKGDRSNAFELRRAFTGIDSSWNHLRGQLAQAAGGNFQGFAGSVQGVDQAEETLRNAMGLNAPPANFYNGGGQAPTGPNDLRRTANALASRAEAVAAILPTEMGGDPNVAALARDAKGLAVAADRFHDSLASGQDPQALQAAYGPVMTLSDRLGPVLTGEGCPPRLRDAWKGYAYADAMTRQILGLDVGANAPPDYLRAPQGPPAAGTAPPPSPVVPLADKLVAQLDDFLTVYTPTARAAPQGLQSLEDATRLRAAAVEFRGRAAQGAAPNQLAFAFRDVDVYWQRLGRRVQRIAGDRTGPNIDRVRALGATCEQLHQMLAMPGYPMIFPDDNLGR